MFGTTIKQIRNSKNMTLKEAAGDVLSISQLSRFENEKTTITVDSFYAVLNNLNTTTEEFNYITGYEEVHEIKETFDRIEKYNNNDQLDKLRHLSNEIRSSHPEPYSWKQFLFYFIDSILDTYDDTEVKADHPVLAYLMQVDDWGAMELRLYAMFGFIFDIETTHFLMRTALKRSKQYLAIPASRRLLYVILSNNFSTFLAADHLEYAEETIRLFEENYAENTDSLAPHIDFLFNKGLLAFKQNEPNQAKEYCENAIKVCQIFHQTEKEKMYQERYDRWRVNYKNPGYRELTIQVGFFDAEED